MQMIVMTSDNYYHCLNPFLSLLKKNFVDYGDAYLKVDIVGFSPPGNAIASDFVNYPLMPVKFHSLGKYEDYPVNKWSDAILKVLSTIADETFILMLEDYWVYRPVDVTGVKILYDYARQFKNVLKIDLARDRLYIDGGNRFAYGYNTYGSAGYIDLVKSPVGTDYQMSLWGGIWNRDSLIPFILPGETAQQIELNGTRRLNEQGDKFLVLGTRQAPLVHGNIYQSGKGGKPTYSEATWEIDQIDLEYFKKNGWIE